MYCRNCGNEMHSEAVVCVKCGVPRGKGNGYCPNCASETHPDAVICVNCGTRFLEPETDESDKSKLVAGLLGIFLGGLGVHIFYLGYTVKAIIQLILTVVVGPVTCFITAGAASIWGLVEGILILCDNINKDAEGKSLQK